METIGPSNLPPWDPYVATCPTRQVLDCVANKWAVLVLGLLSERRHRFVKLEDTMTHAFAPVEEQMELLRRGAVDLVSEADLARKLERWRTLWPSAPGESFSAGDSPATGRRA